MKGALLLIGLMVCASMTEASSPRWAKKQVKPITNRHFKTNVAKGMYVCNYVLYKTSTAKVFLSCSDKNTWESREP